ncbi:MAG: TIGR03088 family PEP-CTERM/XrtA system glycosyltransferase [Pseudomonadota bacterium]
MQQVGKTPVDAQGTPELPLVMHLLYRLDFGGLETVLAECVNRMPADRYRHAIVCLADYTAFSEKITRPGVAIIALHKPPGLGLGAHWKLWKLVRELRPTILHTYNISAVEYAFTASMAGVPICVHAEHGRDLSDLHGKNRKHNLLRRWMTPYIDCFIPVSQDLKHWLRETVGIPTDKNLVINNGVDTSNFRPRTDTATDAHVRTHAVEAAAQKEFIVGTVGRIQNIKNHKGLVSAFLRLLALLPAYREQLVLTIVGDGPLMAELRTQVEASGATDRIRLLGARSDIADLMSTFDVFVLPSFNEGTPITLLEAMASGLPVIASRVGGIPDVVQDHESGMLVSATDHEAIAAALAGYFNDRQLARSHGMAGREVIEKNYSINAMITNYMALYDALCLRKLRLSSSRKVLPSCAE